MNNNYIQVITDEGNLILDLTGKENISFNFLISDIKDISKKKTNYSKNINLPSTKNNHKVFQSIFEITSDNIFNPNKSVNCQFISDGVAVITGKLKLNKINSDLYSNNISYDIVIYSGNFDLVNLLGDKKLVDLNLSGFNHTINSATVVNSWDGTTPYVYPFCDTGAYYTYNNISPNGGTGGFVEFMDFTPWLYVKPLLNKIFEESNLSIQSDFFNSDLFSKLIINTTNKLKYTAEELKAQRFRAEQVSGVIDIQNPLIAVTPTLSSVTVNDDYTVGFDPGNVYNTSTGEIQFPFNNFPTSFELGLNWKDNGFSTASIDFVLRIYLYKNGQVIWDNGQYINCNANNLLNGTWVFTTPEFISNPSDVYQFFIQVETQNPFVGVLQLEAGTYIQNIPGLFDDWLMVGDTVNISNFINPNTKCIDFVSAIFKTFNLYVEPLNTDLSTFVVEPRNNFYLNTPATVVDWTSKIDSFKPIQQTLLSELQSKKFIFTWSKDDDYLNNTYTKNYDGDVFGQSEFEVDNDFLDANSVTKIEPLFTPLIERTIPGCTTINTPILWDWDNSQIKFRESIPFKLAFFNKENCDKYIMGSYRTSFPALQIFTEYGCASSFYPSINNPEFSLNFGTPLETKFLGSAFTNTGFYYPTKNIFTEYYEDFIDEITNKNNRLITLTAKLDAVDISNLSFRNSIALKIDGNLSYFKLNAIKDYNPTDNTTCKIELIKSENTVPPPRIYRRIIVRGDTGNGSGQVGRINLGQNNQVINPFSVAVGNFNIITESNNVVFGNNNYSKGVNSFITGIYNTASTSTFILGGSGNTVQGDFSGVIGGRNNSIFSKLEGESNLIIGSSDSIINVKNSDNIILGSSNSIIQNTGITNSVIIGSENSTIEGYNNTNIVVLGGQNILAKSANTVYSQRNVISEFAVPELPSDSIRMVQTDKVGYLQPLNFYALDGIAITSSGGSLTWSLTGDTPTEDLYWISGTSTGDLLRTNSNHEVNAGNTIVLNGIYNSGYTPNSVISGSRNIAHGSYFVGYSLFTGIYGLNQVNGGVNTIYGSVNNIHNGFYNQINSGAYNSILNGTNQKIYNSSNSILQGSTNKIYSSQNSVVIGNSNIITTANTSYNTFSTILNSTGSRIEDSNFSSILGGKSSSITGGSIYNIHNIILNSDAGKIHGKRNSIINGFNNSILNLSSDSTIISGEQNIITNAKDSIIFNGRINTINASTGVTIINASNITTTSADTNVLITNKIRAISLTGGSTQMVVADTLGNLSTQAITSGGTSYSGVNVGNGYSIFTGVTGTDFQFKTLSGKTNISLSANSDTIFISSTYPNTAFLTQNNTNIGALPSQYKRYYSNCINFSNSFGAVNPGANTLRLFPWVNNRKISLNEVGINVTTSATSNGSFTIALYDSLGVGSLTPNNLLSVFGSGSTMSTGVKLVTGSTITIDPGLYFWAFNTNSTAQFSAPANSNACIGLGSNGTITSQVGSMSSAVTYSMSFPSNVSNFVSYAQTLMLFSYYPLTILD